MLRAAAPSQRGARGSDQRAVSPSFRSNELSDRVRLSAPLRDKVTWIASCWLSQTEDQVLQVETLGRRPESELSRERRAPPIPWQSPLSTNRRSHNEHPLGTIPVNEKCELHFLDNHSQLATWLGPGGLCVRR